MEKKTIIVEGMSCNHCVAAVTSALTEIGAEHVDVNLDKGTVQVQYEEGKLTDSKMAEAIEDQGYDVKGIQ